MSENNYLFVDGSSLLGDINRLWNDRPAFRDNRLIVSRFQYHFTRFYPAFVNGYKRFSFYFVEKENRTKKYIDLPNFTNPGEVEDIHIKHCGALLPGSKKFQNWIEGNSPPQVVMDRLNKAEKAVDTQICCDALQLAGLGKLDRLMLYTNDYDFMPLLDTMKAFGCNVSLFQLTSKDVNKKLVANCDSYHVPDAQRLLHMFGLKDEN
ncbi:MAG: NYN domain-containing protein [Verrucomicrobiota bacterium]